MSISWCLYQSDILLFPLLNTQALNDTLVWKSMRKKMEKIDLYRITKVSGIYPLRTWMSATYCLVIHPIFQPWLKWTNRLTDRQTIPWPQELVSTLYINSMVLTYRGRVLGRTGALQVGGGWVRGLTGGVVWELRWVDQQVDRMLQKVVQAAVSPVVRRGTNTQEVCGGREKKCKSLSHRLDVTQQGHNRYILK